MLTDDQINQIRHFNRQYTQALGVLNKHVFNMELTLPEGRVLIEINQNPSATPLLIANHLSLDKSYTSRIINQLVKKGLINKAKSEKDLRSVNLNLTKAGFEVFNIINKRSNQQITNLLSNLSSPQQDEYFKAVMKIDELIFGRNG